MDLAAGPRRTALRVRAWPPRVRAWPLWALPVGLLMSILAVEATAALFLVTGLLRPPGDTTLRDLAVLVVAAAMHIEARRDTERMRRRLLETDLYVNLSSVWFLAAAVVLSPGWAGLCAVVVHTHLCVRSVGPRVPPHRRVFSGAVFVLAAVAASATAGWLREVVPPAAGVLVVGAAILVFFTVNTALVAGVIATNDKRAGLAMVIGDGDENLLEVATLCLGGIVAAALSVDPWLVLLVLPPLLVLHRAVLVRHLERAASTDAKTGLLNASAWHTQAERALGRRRSPAAGLLVLDLDHFKRVNDTYGHLVGDVVLHAVADVLRDGTRAGDLVGRFGGEEFVVLVGRADDPAAEPVADLVPAVADRLRRRVAALSVAVETPDGPLTITGLSVSIGAALRPDDAGSAHLRALMHAADTALYAAKRAGRNRVRTSDGTALAAPPPLAIGSGGAVGAARP